MKKHLRKIGIFFVLVFAAYVFFFDYSEALYRRFPLLKQTAAAYGVFMELDSLILHSPTSLEFRKLSTFVKNNSSLIPIFIDSGEITYKILSLLLFNVVAESSLKAYGGNATIHWTNNLLSKEATLTFEIADINLLDYPLTFATGISGKLFAQADVQLTANRFSSFDITNGNLHIKVLEGRYNGGHEIFRGIKSPEIRDLTIDLYAKQFRNRIGISALDIYSSLGKATGTGFVHLDNRNQLDRARIELQARLTPEGTKLYGGFFALAAGLPVDNPSRNWKILALKKKGEKWDFNIRPQL